MNEQAIETMLRNLYVDLERSASHDQRNELFAKYASDIANLADNDVVSLSEAAEMLGLSRQRVHVLLGNGQLIGYKVGNTWNVYKSSVEKRLAR